MKEDSGISPIHSQALHQFVGTLKPSLAIEIGMANGHSSMAILSAPGIGKLISIDPYQSTEWESAGMQAVAKFSSHHCLIEQPDYLALPQLIAAGTRINFAYIDGYHTFDYVLLDFFYLDKMLEVGGVIGFNDCNLASVNKVIRWLLKHRKYVEVPVLKPTYDGRHIGISLARRVLNRQTQDRYFSKVEDWQPHWKYHKFF